jgi:hypothetical protein
MNREQILGALARGYCTDDNQHKVLDSTLLLAMAEEIEALQPQGEPVAYVWDEAAYPDGDVRGRGWHEAMGRHHPNHPAMTRNVVQLYAAPPADGVDELAALQSELAEQCRLNGMGSEREARLMAQLQEAERKLAEAITEIEILRRFGNKDCTNMADEELDLIRALMKEGGK